MFRVKIQLPNELATQYVEQIKTGVRGVGYVKVNEAAVWPDWLEKGLVQPTASGEAPAGAAAQHEPVPASR